MALTTPQNQAEASGGAPGLATFPRLWLRAACGRHCGSLQSRTPVELRPWGCWLVGDTAALASRVSLPAPEKPERPTQQQSGDQLRTRLRSRRASRQQPGDPLFSKKHYSPEPTPRGGRGLSAGPTGDRPERLQGKKRTKQLVGKVRGGTGHGHRVLAWAAVTHCRWAVQTTERSTHCSRGWKSKSKVPSKLGRGESVLLGHLLAVSPRGLPQCTPAERDVTLPPLIRTPVVWLGLHLYDFISP